MESSTTENTWHSSWNGFVQGTLSAFLPSSPSTSQAGPSTIDQWKRDSPVVVPGSIKPIRKEPGSSTPNAPSKGPGVSANTPSRNSVPPPATTTSDTSAPVKNRTISAGTVAKTASMESLSSSNWRSSNYNEKGEIFITSSETISSTQLSPKQSQTCMELPRHQQAPPDPREKKFRALFEQDNVELEEIQALCWNGISQDFRAEYWQLLLGYMPTLKERREKTLATKRNSYWDSVKQFWTLDTSDYEEEMYDQICKDVPRTSSDVPFFHYSETRTMLTRILYIWAMRHPASGYVQGINDLAAPFICVFLHPHLHLDHYYAITDGFLIQDPEQLPTPNEISKIFKLYDPSETDLLEAKEAKDVHGSETRIPVKISELLKNIEADTFWCLTNFLERIQDNYTPIQPGIQRMLYKLKHLTQKLDISLHEHLEVQKLEYFQFGFRWMNCLLTRELPLNLLTRVWDTYLSEGEAFPALHVYFCTAFLIHWSSQIKEKDFNSLMLYIQNLPTKNWTESEIGLLLAQAYVWRNAYEDTKGHFK